MGNPTSDAGANRRPGHDPQPPVPPTLALVDLVQDRPAKVGADIVDPAVAPLRVHPGERLSDRILGPVSVTAQRGGDVHKPHVVLVEHEPVAVLHHLSRSTGT